MAAAWWQRAVIYQIYPRSFADSDGDGVGDLRGIVSRLDYLRPVARARGRALGADAIWLSPFYPSPMADFGYDVSDYTSVDPAFGSLEDFDELLDAAHRRNIKVIVDWVPNHTSDRHPWFLDSRSSRGSPKRDWYVWRDPASDGGPPNNWRSSFKGVGAAWTLDQASGQYYLHSFLPQQPDLNWENPEVEAAMHDVLRFWLRRGVDGFRVDVVYKLAKDPELGDDEPHLRHDQDWPTIHGRLRRIRAVVDEYHERMLVGEVYLLDLPRVVRYVNSGDELHLAHNFVFVRLPWNAGAFRGSVREFERLAEPHVWPAWFLENHDHPRVASRYASDELGSGERRARLAALMVLTLRGTPFLYQGQELGLPDAEIPPARAVDVDGRDPERAPMPWSRPSRAGAGAGFTTGEPWLPIVRDADRLSVEAQDADPESTLAFVREMLALRGRTPALQLGVQRRVDAAPELFCYLREREDTRLLVALNFRSQTVALALRQHLADRAIVELSTRPQRPRGEIELAALALERDEGIILRLAEDQPGSRGEGLLSDQRSARAG